MMDSFEFNKIAGAVLFSVLVMLGLRALGDTIFHVDAPEKPGYAVEIAETGTSASGGQEAAKEEVPLAQLLASADVAKGLKGFKKCSACHKAAEGAKAGVGPNLHGIVGKAMAGADGFAYSPALKEFGAGKTWGYEELNAFLKKPKSYVPGTKMSFAGLKKGTDRANLLAYLKSVSPGAPEFPTE
ncbi:MAG: cytochrome c family protein [Pseudomonadota bacterium]